MLALLVTLQALTKPLGQLVTGSFVNAVLAVTVLVAGLSGGITVLVWKLVIRAQFKGTVLDFYELLPAFIIACVAIVVVSLITKAPDEEITSVYDELKAC